LNLLMLAFSKLKPAAHACAVAPSPDKPSLQQQQRVSLQLLLSCLLIQLLAEHTCNSHTNCTGGADSGSNSSSSSSSNSSSISAEGFTVLSTSCRSGLVESWACMLECAEKLEGLTWEQHQSEQHKRQSASMCIQPFRPLQGLREYIRDMMSCGTLSSLLDVMSYLLQLARHSATAATSTGASSSNGQGSSSSSSSSSSGGGGDAVDVKQVVRLVDWHLIMLGEISDAAVGSAVSPEGVALGLSGLSLSLSGFLHPSGCTREWLVS
jgi:hypothetical protein